MPVVVSLLRGVNVGGHNIIKMDALRALYESLGFRNAQTYVQSGNVVFKTAARDLAPLSKRIEDGIQASFGFRPSVILRTVPDLRNVIARNPYAGRNGIEPGKLLVAFLENSPGPAQCACAMGLCKGPEELRMDGREMYIYFPDGMGKSKLTWTRIEKALEMPGTGRNWNTVMKLLEMGESMMGS